MSSASGRLPLTAFQPMVVEPYPVRVLAADFPILVIFKLSHLCIFHHYVVVYKTLRESQQFKGIHYILSKYNGLTIYNFNYYTANSVICQYIKLYILIFLTLQCFIVFVNFLLQIIQFLRICILDK